MDLSLSDSKKGRTRGMARRPGKGPCSCDRREGEGVLPTSSLEDRPGATARAWQAKENKCKTEWETRF